MQHPGCAGRILCLAALLGGMVAAPAGAAFITYLPITKDADCGISSSKTYTHAIDFGSGTLASINGVAFVRGLVGSLPANFTYVVSSGSRSDHAGGNAGGYDIVSGSNLINLMHDFIYNGNNAVNGTATGTLLGLTPGTTYDVRIYARQWDSATHRHAVIEFDTNNDGVYETTLPTVDENHALENPPGLDRDNRAYALSYVFVAQSDRLVIRMTQAGSNQSWHWYGLTNEVVPALPTTPLGAIGINFCGANPAGSGGRGEGIALEPEAAPGIVAQPFWNNAFGTSGSVASLVNDRCEATAASVTWTGSGASALPYQAPYASDADALMKGYLDAVGASTTTVTVSNIPFPLYDVYVFVDGDNGGATRTAQYTIGSVSYTFEDTPNSDFSGQFDEITATDPHGNYMVFRWMTSSSFTLTAAGLTASDGNLRAPISAIQIVAVPEPGALGLVGLGLLALVRRRRAARLRGPR